MVCVCVCVCERERERERESPDARETNEFSVRWPPSDSAVNREARVRPGRSHC